MLKLGLETESYHLFFQNHRMDIFDFIDRAYRLGFDGVQINIIVDQNLDPEFGTLQSSDPEYLRRVRRAIEERGLYCEIDTRFTSLRDIQKGVYIANALGADVMRTYMFRLGQFKPELLAQRIADLKAAVPLLRQNRIKLAVENHEEETADELISVIKAVDSPWVGALCDIGNGMMAWEDPVVTTEKLAPYTVSTHFKDHLVTMSGDVPVVCGCPLGSGSIDLKKCFSLLLERSSVSRINLEACFPYASAFKREPGTGGWTKGFTGAFELKEPPFDRAKAEPLEYYYPSKISEELLEEMLIAQDDCVKQSIKVLRALREELCPAVSTPF